MFSMFWNFSEDLILLKHTKYVIFFCKGSNQRSNQIWWSHGQRNDWEQTCPSGQKARLVTPWWEWIPPWDCFSGWSQGFTRGAGKTEVWFIPPVCHSSSFSSSSCAVYSRKIGCIDLQATVPLTLTGQDTARLSNWFYASSFIILLLNFTFQL